MDSIFMRKGFLCFILVLSIFGCDRDEVASTVSQTAVEEDILDAENIPSAQCLTPTNDLEEEIPAYVGWNFYQKQSLATLSLSFVDEGLSAFPVSKHFIEYTVCDEDDQCLCGDDFHRPESLCQMEGTPEDQAAAHLRTYRFTDEILVPEGMVGSLAISARRCIAEPSEENPSCGSFQNVAEGINLLPQFKSSERELFAKKVEAETEVFHSVAKLGDMALAHGDEASPYSRSTEQIGWLINHEESQSDHCNLALPQGLSLVEGEDQARAAADALIKRRQDAFRSAFASATVLDGIGGAYSGRFGNSYQSNLDALIGEMKQAEKDRRDPNWRQLKGQNLDPWDGHVETYFKKQQGQFAPTIDPKKLPPLFRDGKLPSMITGEGIAKPSYVVGAGPSGYAKFWRDLSHGVDAVMIEARMDYSRPQVITLTQDMLSFFRDEVLGRDNFKQLVKAKAINPSVEHSNAYDMSVQQFQNIMHEVIRYHFGEVSKARKSKRWLDTNNRAIAPILRGASAVFHEGRLIFGRGVRFARTGEPNFDARTRLFAADGIYTLADATGGSGSIYVDPNYTKKAALTDKTKHYTFSAKLSDLGPTMTDLFKKGTFPRSSNLPREFYKAVGLKLEAKDGGALFAEVKFGGSMPATLGDYVNFAGESEAFLVDFLRERRNMTLQQASDLGGFLNGREFKTEFVQWMFATKLKASVVWADRQGQQRKEPMTDQQYSDAFGQNGEKVKANWAIGALAATVFDLGAEVALDKDLVRTVMDKVKVKRTSKEYFRAVIRTIHGDKVLGPHFQTGRGGSSGGEAGIAVSDQQFDKFWSVYEGVALESGRNGNLSQRQFDTLSKALIESGIGAREAIRQITYVAAVVSASVHMNRDIVRTVGPQLGDLASINKITPNIGATLEPVKVRDPKRQRRLSQVLRNDRHPVTIQFKRTAEIAVKNGQGTLDGARNVKNELQDARGGLQQVQPHTILGPKRDSKTTSSKRRPGLGNLDVYALVDGDVQASTFGEEIERLGGVISNLIGQKQDWLRQLHGVEHYGSENLVEGNAP